MGVSPFKGRAPQRSIAKAQRPGILKAGRGKWSCEPGLLGSKATTAANRDLFCPGQGLYFRSSLPPDNHVAQSPTCSQQELDGPLTQASPIHLET